jgi:hypothetical protein
MNKESKCEDKEISNIKNSQNSSHNRVPLLGLSFGDIDSCSSRQLSWCVRILLMESINSVTLRITFYRLPLRHIITNALDQVLEFAVVYAGGPDCLDKVFIFAMNLNWQWWIGPLT